MRRIFYVHAFCVCLVAYGLRVYRKGVHVGRPVVDTLKNVTYVAYNGTTSLLRTATVLRYIACRYITFTAALHTMERCVLYHKQRVCMSLCALRYYLYYTTCYT